jgi:hypothetical protein
VTLARSIAYGITINIAIPTLLLVALALLPIDHWAADVIYFACWPAAGVFVAFAVLRAYLEGAKTDGLRSGAILAVVSAPIIPSLVFGTFIGRQPLSVSSGFIVSELPTLLPAILVCGLIMFVIGVLASRMRRLHRVTYYAISAVIAGGVVAGTLFVFLYMMAQGGA